MDREHIRRQAKYELARRDFWWYCHLKAPRFYQPNRQYLKDLCQAFQAFYESGEEVLIINLPPRHGKSRTAGLFVEWVLGKNHEEKVMTGSYNETLSTTFAKNVRNSIQEIKADPEITVFSDIFPGTAIKQGDGAMNLWSLEDGYNNYLATSPTGTATGFGASILVIDDLIKNALEANNEMVKQKHWEWFTDTMLSRLEEGGKIVIIMTRWASDDLAGRALEYYQEEEIPVRHLCMKALQDDGTMLCEEVLSRRTYEGKIKLMGSAIASANYQQEPIDLKGCLYSHFKTYDGPLPEFKEIRNYTDTADTGEDFLCSINYGVTFQGEAYVLDILYTQESMEQTEPATANMLFCGSVNRADIESNNGGRGFARAIKRILTEELHSNYTTVCPFTQSKNKVARILSHATWVMEHIYFPANWKNRWPDYYKAMTRYQREGKNTHDDAPDATTGIAERVSRGNAISFM